MSSETQSIFEYPDIEISKNEPPRKFGLIKLKYGIFSRKYVLSIEGLGYLGLVDGKLSFFAKNPVVFEDVFVVDNKSTLFIEKTTNKPIRVEALGLNFNGQLLYVDMAGRLCSAVNNSFYDVFCVYHDVVDNGNFNNQTWQKMQKYNTISQAMIEESAIKSNRKFGKFYSTEQKNQMETVFISRLQKLQNRKQLFEDNQKNV